MTTQDTHDPQYFSRMADALDRHPDYRVLRRLHLDTTPSDPSPLFPHRGLVIDTETTGLDTASDLPIDIGMLLFSFDDEGRIGPLLAHYEGLQDPGRPLPPEIVELTGYHDEDLAGRSFDVSRIEHLLLQAEVVIAHNAGFDRKIVERITPVAATKPWGCSSQDIRWRAQGKGSQKLEFLVYAYGYFFDGHTALADANATLFVLGENCPDGHPHPTPLAELLHAVNHPRIRVAATGAPFASKDELKARTYRWSDGSSYHKAWWKDIEHDQLEAELAWLEANVYGKDARRFVKLETVSPRDRYSIRCI